MRRFSSLILAGLLGLPAFVSGQDLEMLGARYGTPVPERYLRSMLGGGDEAFQFRRGWSARIGEIPKADLNLAQI